MGEVVVSRASGDDQRVVVHLLAIVQKHVMAGNIEISHFPQQHARYRCACERSLAIGKAISAGESAPVATW